MYPKNGREKPVDSNDIRQAMKNPVKPATTPSINGSISNIIIIKYGSNPIDFRRPISHCLLYILV